MDAQFFIYHLILSSVMYYFPDTAALATNPMVLLQVPSQAVNAKGIMDATGMLSWRIPAQCRSDVKVQLTVKTQGLAMMAAVHGTTLRQHCSHTNNTTTILSACTCGPSRERRYRAANNTGHISLVDRASLARGKMSVFQCHRP